MLKLCFWQHMCSCFFWFFFRFKAKHLQHNRRISALCSDVQICIHPNMSCTSKLTVGLLLVKNAAVPKLSSWFWSWTLAQHLHGSRIRDLDGSHLPENDLPLRPTGVTTLPTFSNQKKHLFYFSQFVLCQTT